MADYIPFVNTDRDCEILKKYYKDPRIIRVSLETIDNIERKIPQNLPLWIDASIDGYQHRLATKWPKEKTKWGTRKQQLWNNLENLFKDYDGYQILANENLWIKTNLPKIQTFVNQVLDKCYSYNPIWITIPQLPLVNDGKRNKINKWLAEETKKRKNSFEIDLILPVIFTSTTQLTRKPIRDNKLQLVEDCYKRANADGIWIVDTTLVDQNRNEQFPKRYSKLIEFHESVIHFLSPKTIIAGPYWGINLVLWARGLCDYPAISLGTAYTYYFSCGVPSRGNVRLAIPPLRRWVVVSGLKSWLEKAIKKLSPIDPTFKDFEYLYNNFSTLSQKDPSIHQVAKFYKKWIEEIESLPPKGKALGLYQNLSSTYVLGKQLPNLPQSALPYCRGKTLEAGKVGEQLMLECL